MKATPRRQQPTGRCDTHYRTWRKANEMRSPEYLAKLAERLKLKYQADANGCWLWTGRLNPDGYGRLGAELAHRLMMMTNGHNIEGLEVDHLCLVRNCVNPQHLEVVTGHTNRSRMHARRAS